MGKEENGSESVNESGKEKEKLQTANRKLQTANRKLQTANRKPPTAEKHSTFQHFLHNLQGLLKNFFAVVC